MECHNSQSHEQGNSDHQSPLTPDITEQVRQINFIVRADDRGRNRRISGVLLVHTSSIALKRNLIAKNTLNL
jgi:hypothetical protein